MTTSRAIAVRRRAAVVALAQRLWSQAWLLLCVMAFLFGANGVAARLATNEMPPLCLVFLRWLFVCLALAALLSRAQRVELSLLLRNHWRRLAWMSLFGFSGYNAIFFIAAYYTTAVNLTLLQTAIPPFALVGAALVFGMRIRALQVGGVALTVVGVLIVAAHGDLDELSRLHFGTADVSILIACAFYAIYALGLRARPKMSALVFFAGLAVASTFWAVPMAVVEIAAGHAYWPSLKGWVVTLFVAIGPSLIGQIFFMRGVDLIGPGRAGLSTNLVPIAGAVCAVFLLHEPFTAADAIALALALGGIGLAEWSAARGLRGDAARVAAQRAIVADGEPSFRSGTRHPM